MLHRFLSSLLLTSESQMFHLMWTVCFFMFPEQKVAMLSQISSSKSLLSLAARLGLSLSSFISQSIYLSEEILSIEDALNNQEVRFEAIISAST